MIRRLHFTVVGKILFARFCLQHFDYTLIIFFILHIRYDVLILGHFTVVGKILFATFRLHPDNRNVANKILPTTMKCPKIKTSYRVCNTWRLRSQRAHYSGNENTYGYKYVAFWHIKLIGCWFNTYFWIIFVYTNFQAGRHSTLDISRFAVM